MASQLKKNKVLYTPLFIFIVVIISLGIGISTVFKQFSSLTSKISVEKSQLNLLQARVDTLRNYGNIASARAADVLVALPPSSSSLLIMSQLRREAVVNELTLDNVSVNNLPNTESELSLVSIEFELGGSYDRIIQFIQNVSKTTPIIGLDKLEIEESQGSYLARVNLNSYWAPFPELLPVSKPLEGLTPAEQATISEISGFTSPSIQSPSGLTPQEVPQREDPFSISF
jgi:Tfp pilus assembly protein PilO